MGASIAQLVERDLAKVEVTSSNLVTRSKLLIPKDASIAQLVERNLAKVEVTSSNLVTRSNFYFFPHSVKCTFESQRFCVGV